MACDNTNKLISLPKTTFNVPPDEFKVFLRPCQRMSLNYNTVYKRRILAISPIKHTMIRKHRFILNVLFSYRENLECLPCLSPNHLPLINLELLYLLTIKYMHFSVHSFWLWLIWLRIPNDWLLQLHNLVPWLKLDMNLLAHFTIVF